VSWRERQLERATEDALAGARVKARSEGRAPTVAEYTEAINSVRKPEPKKRRKREKTDDRAWKFDCWLRSKWDDYYLDQIREMPGGLDITYLAGELINGRIREEDCRDAIRFHKEAIELIERVLEEAIPEKAGQRLRQWFHQSRYPTSKR
jgi:hypothetical protein